MMSTMLLIAATVDGVYYMCAVLFNAFRFGLNCSVLILLPITRGSDRQQGEEGGKRTSGRTSEMETKQG